jgi:3',5'-cyclic AMP phosphodiesterase CpdA
MPLHLVSRRQFLVQLGAAAVVSGSRAAAPGSTLVAVLNDTHIGEKQPADSAVPANLRRTVEALLALPERPAAVVINGDLALKDGQRGDYVHFARLIAPLREAGVPVHLTMGNHDDRAVFYDVLKQERPAAPVVASKHAAVIRLAGANLFLLDSLKQTMITQGLLGEVQRDWLARALDAEPGKPALVFAHHNPRLGGDPVHFPGGLEDSEELWKLLASRPQVKAYLHGHIHHREFYSHEGIHLLNTPATSYVADKATSTTGWTLLHMGDSGMRVTTHTHLSNHPWNGVAVDLAWRA